MSGDEVGQVYDTVSHLSRQLRVAQAERDLYKAKYGEALAALTAHDEGHAHAIDTSDRVQDG